MPVAWFPRRAANRAGELRVRAPAVGSDVAIGTFAANLDNAGAIVIEPFHAIDVADHIGAGDFAGYRSSITQYATAAVPAITARLGAELGTRLTVQPGLELRRDGDLTINSDASETIDFSTWRFAGQPVSLRACRGRSHAQWRVDGWRAVRGLR